jgi:ubiquinone/menaquinone biosynthesis C-methylase UbiE
MNEEAFWDISALFYDRLRLLVPYEELLAELADDIHGRLRPMARILDVGCGTGRALERMRMVRQTYALTGIDRSRAMLHIAHHNLRRKGVALMRHDVDRGLPFEDGRFDLVHCCNVLYAVNDPAYLMEELRRVLAPKGFLVIVNPWNPGQKMFWLDHAMRVVMDGGTLDHVRTLINLPAFAGIALMHKRIAEQACARAYHFFEIGELLDLVRKQGFKDISQTTDAYGITCCRILAQAT